MSKVKAEIDPRSMLTPADVQKILRVSKPTLYSYLRGKDPIPSYKIGKHRRFNLEKLLWWIEKHES